MRAERSTTAVSSRVERVRRILLTASMVLAPLMLVAADLIWLDVDWTDMEATVANAAEEPGRWQLRTGLMLASFMLLVPAALAVGELISRRRPALGFAGGTLLALGAMSISANVLGDLRLAAAAGQDVTAVASFVEEGMNLGAVLPLMALGVLGAVIGMVVLVVGLWRSRITPRWVVAAFAAATVLNVVRGGGPLALVTSLLLLVAFVGIARSYLADPAVREPAAGVEDGATPASA